MDLFSFFEIDVKFVVLVISSGLISFVERLFERLFQGLCLLFNLKLVYLKHILLLIEHSKMFIYLTDVLAYLFLGRFE